MNEEQRREALAYMSPLAMNSLIWDYIKPILGKSKPHGYYRQNKGKKQRRGRIK